MTDSHADEVLVAILAADVVGYSKLMEDDERATVAMLDSYRLVFKDHVEAHGGRIVDMAGDSVLAVFPGAARAAMAAIDIQRELKKRNDGVPVDRRMQFRIGVNLGDVIVKEDGSVYGDGVNVAARLEALAEPGGIRFSGSVYYSVQSKLGVALEFLGEHSVKNIARPVGVYRVQMGEAPARSRRGFAVKPIAIGAAVVLILVIAGIGVWQAGWLAGGPTMEQAAAFRPAAHRGPSIAVLPLQNLSGDPEQGYFSDGLTEDIISALGRFSGLTVLAGNATARFRDTDLPPAEIGRQLGVAYLLQGSVRRTANQVRLTTQLTDAQTGVHLWSDRYDAEIADLFAVQDDMTAKIAGALAIELSNVEQARAKAKPTSNRDAYDLVLQGWSQYRAANRSANNQARELFERAIEIDPNYAAAYAGMGWSRIQAIEHGYTEFLIKALNDAESLAKKALALDPDNVRAHSLMAAVFNHKGEHAQAAAELQRALEINSSDAQSYKEYGNLLVWSGHHKSAIEWFEAALEIDPDMEPIHMTELALAYYLDRRYQDAAAAAQHSFTRNSTLTYTPIVLAAVYGQLGQEAEIESAVEAVYRLNPFFTIEWYTTNFANPDAATHVTEGLEKAGLRRKAEPRS